MQLTPRFPLRPLALALALSLTGASGCALQVAESPEIASSSQALESENGIKSSNGFRSSNGIKTINGYRTINGFKSTNGIRSSNGIRTSNGFKSMNGMKTVNGLGPLSSLSYVDPLTGEPLALPAADTEDGREFLAYMIGCALPEGTSVTLHDTALNPYGFDGAIGVAPEWEDGICNVECQQWVTACVLSHVNLTGEHVGIWMDAANEAIGWGSDPAYPREEGAYFGNLFLDEPEVYACKGVDADVDPIAGRLCLGDADCPYVDAAAGGSCEDICSARAEGDGYTECRVGTQKFKTPVTIFTE